MEKVRLELRFFRLSERRLSLGGGGERGHSRQGAQHRERPRGKNSFEQALWSLPPCMRGAGLWPQGRKGAQQGKPAEAGPCSGGRDPAPGA